MDNILQSLSKRLKRIGIFELIVFLLSCGVHYIAYKSQGKLPFSSWLDMLFILSWPALAGVMVYGARMIDKKAKVTPRQVMAVTLIYGALYAYWTIGVIPMIFNGKIPLLIKTTGPMPWLLLRGWFCWLLIGGAIELIKAERAAAQAAVESASSQG